MSAADQHPPAPGGPGDGHPLDDIRLQRLLHVVMRGQGVIAEANTARADRLRAVNEIRRAAESDSTSLPQRVLTIVREMLVARDRLNVNPGDREAWTTLCAGWVWLPTLREEIDTYLDGPNWTWAAPECRPGAVAGRRSRAGVESYEIRRCPAALRDQPHPPHLDQADGWACAGVLTDPADGDGLDPAVHDPDHRPDTHAGEWS